MPRNPAPELPAIRTLAVSWGTPWTVTVIGKIHDDEDAAPCEVDDEDNTITRVVTTVDRDNDGNPDGSADDRQRCR